MTSVEKEFEKFVKKNSLEEIVYKYHSTDLLLKYVLKNIDKYNDDDLYDIIVFGHIYNNKLLDRIKNPMELIAHTLLSSNDIIEKYYFIDRKYDGDFNKLVKNIIEYVCANNEYSDTKFLLLNLFKILSDKKMVFLRELVNAKIDKELIANVISEGIYNENKLLNDEEINIIKPYLSDELKSLLQYAKNPKILFNDVIISKDKEVIAYYIWKANDAYLLKKLFNTSDKYDEYCKRTFSNITYNKIKTWIKEEIDFKYVDDNIEDFIKSSNEIIVK